MNKLVLFVLLVACGSILADTASTCAGIYSQSQCELNKACIYTPIYSCFNKCEAFSITDCALPANSSKCNIFSSCQIKVDCSQFQSQPNCKAQSLCLWSSANFCYNSVSAQACEQLSDQNSCKTNNGCLWQPIRCQNNVNTSCSRLDNQVTCKSQAKFCDYIQTSGDCSVQSSSGNSGTSSNSGTPSNSNTPSTSSQILAISLITIIALI